MQREVFLKSKLDGSLFKGGRLLVRTKIKRFRSTKLLSTDDAALVAHDQMDFKHLMSNFKRHVIPLIGISLHPNW